VIGSGIFGCDMELYPVKLVFGFPEIAWSLRQWARRRLSDGWADVPATVEGYELLRSRENGWFVVFYSYEYADRQYSGECRKWLLSVFRRKRHKPER
jgi:hypothetical protein